MTVESTHIECAPLLLVFGPLAGRVAGLVRVCPDILPRIVLAPRRAIHSIATFLYFAPEASLPDDDVADVIATRHPRDLLRAAFPNAPARLYRTLEKCGDRVHQQFFYFRLVSLSVTAVAEDVFACRHIDERQITIFEKWNDLDPVVQSCRGALGGVGYRGDALDLLVRFARAHRVLKAGDLAPPEGAGLRAVVKRILKMIDRIQVSPPFTLPPPLRVITSLGELRKTGFQFRNCLRNPTEQWFEFTEGRLTFVVSNAPRLIASMRQVAPDAWLVENVAGENNAYVDRTSKELLAAAIRRAGVRLWDESPYDAIRVLFNDLARGAPGDFVDDDVRELESALDEVLAG